MTDKESNLAARKAVNISTFARLKNLVRELEDEEKRIGADFTNSEIEFKLNASDIAWYVAYRTAMAQITLEGSDIEGSR